MSIASRSANQKTRPRSAQLDSVETGRVIGTIGVCPEADTPQTELFPTLAKVISLDLWKYMQTVPKTFRHRDSRAPGRRA